MKRYIIPIVAMLLMAACGEDKDDRSPEAVINNMEDDYLLQIQQLGIDSLYKEVKWRLYCNHCDIPVKNCMGRKIPGLTYGMLDLKVFFLKFEDSTGELAYTFIYNDSLQCSVDDVTGNKIHGIGFERNGKAPLYYISAGDTARISIHCDTLPDITGCPTRMINPEQPVVTKYLTANREKLNPWFHMEAVKRGLLDD